MTHMTEQRWVATPSELVTKVVLDHRYDPAFHKRFYEKIDVGFDVDDCHIWIGALSSEGYGNFSVKRHTVRAHRIAWMIRFGEVPTATPFLDHVNCLGRFCVNADHLEPVDNEENTRRGVGTGARAQRELRREELFRREAVRATEVEF